MSARIKSSVISTWLLAAWGIWLIALGVYFIFLRPPLLPEDARFMGSSIAQIRAAVPGLEAWLTRVFSVMGGFMAGTGVLVIFTARTAIPSHLRGTSWTLAVSGLLTVVLMSLVNFDLHSDFRWLLLGPVLIWLFGLLLYIARR
jgi:hypothetical protein